MASGRKRPQMFLRALRVPKQGFFLTLKITKMKHPQDAAKLAALTEFIDSYFGGQLDEMVRQLYETIYMLHYLNPDQFCYETRLEKAFLLHCIAGCLQTEPEPEQEAK